MKACKCDRCGSYYDYYGAEIPESITSSKYKVNQICLSKGFGNNIGDEAQGIYAVLDLCPVCMDYILSQLTISPVSKEEFITNGDIYRDMEKEYPFMHPDDWRPEGAMKIRVWGNGHVYIYDYNAKKLYEVGELE